MFSPEVVCDDKFIDMPTSTQALYFQLGMHADDDGFIGPKKIMRIISASEDDLKILIGKKFVIPFESGVVVVRHWRVNNLIRKDWYRPSIHVEEKGLISFDKSGVYHFVNELAPNSSTQVVSKLVSNKASKEAGRDAPQLTHAEQIKKMASMKRDLTRKKIL